MMEKASKIFKLIIQILIIIILIIIGANLIKWGGIPINVN